MQKPIASVNEHHHRGAAMSTVILKRSIAETLGAFALTFTGCAAIIVNSIHEGSVGNVGISMVFGLIVMTMVVAIGETSGAHINPAVTTGFLLAGRMKTTDAVAYWIAQSIGAILAALSLRAMFSGQDVLGVTNPSGSDVQSLALEAVMTFFLMFVILCVATGSKEQGLMAGIAIGGIIGLEALLGGPVSGASMNPARSLGPALVAGDVAKLWIYIVGPVVGSAIAVPAWMIAIKKR